jgi:hypothetical protein
MEEFIQLYHKDTHNDTPIITETTKSKKNLQRYTEKSNLSRNNRNIHNSDYYHDIHHHRTLNHDDDDDDDRIQMINRIKQCCHDGFISWKNLMNKTIVIQARTLVNANHDDCYNNKDNDNDHNIHSSIPQVDEFIHSSLSHFMLNHQDSNNNNNNSADDEIYDYIMGHSLPPPASSLLSSPSSSLHTTKSLSALMVMINKILTTQNDEGSIFINTCL